MARKNQEPGFAFSRDLVLSSETTPQVLRDYRELAWQNYQELSFPSLKDEAWRRTSLRDFDFEGVQLARTHLSPEDTNPTHYGVISDKLRHGRSTAVVSPSGVVIQRTKRLEEAGVIFSSLEDAAGKHPDLVKKILGQAVSPSQDIFAAVTGALAGQGIFIYVPRGIRLDEPLIGIALAGAGGTAQFFQTLIYLEEDSALTYLQETLSPWDQEQPSLAGESMEIYVGQNASLNLTELQNYGPKVWSFGHKKALVDRAGKLEWDIGALGSLLTKHFVSVDLIGEGAEGRVSGMMYSDRDQHLSYNTLQRHLAPRTTSDLLFKAALNGSSRSVWRGMIYAAPGAQFIDGYQANRNLVLDPDARSDSIPGLEILNNDVRCTHGSTIGKIDQEQLFYLLSRGIPRREAEQLVIQGFFEDILSRFVIPEVREELWLTVQKRLLPQDEEREQVNTIPI